MIKSAIKNLIEKKDLTEEHMSLAMNEIMNGNATYAQIGSFLTALNMKGETIEEICAGATVMRNKALKVKVSSPYAIDTCGTGGDGLNTFNISTAATFVVAATGITVIKHGNRSVSSKCGSADVLESLGVKVDLSPEQVERCIEKLNIGFMFAPKFHIAMKNVMGPRRELGVRTIFNMIGPLTNPARVKAQLIGVFANENYKKVKDIADYCKLDVLQLHGSEDLGYCRSLSQYKIWKAFRIRNKESINQINYYNVNGILLDTFSKSKYGGTGNVFDWNIVSKLSQRYFTILAGGLNPNNVLCAINIVNPNVVDVSSGVEIDEIKDFEKIKKFIENVRG